MALWRIRATVDDRPGYLSVLTASLALRSVNILAVQVHTTEGGAVDDFLVDAPDALSVADLLAAVTKGRGRDAFITRAEAQGLADQPTRALALAGRLVLDPDALGEVLVTLLEADEARWRPAVERAGLEPGRMTLADPAGGSLEVLRTAPAFTPAEYARAQALVELSSALLHRDAHETTLLLPDGAELLIRPATGDDAGAVRDLHEQCSPGTLTQRYLGGDRIPSDARVAGLLEPAGGVTLLALDGDRAVAMANLLAEGELGEIAMLVADGWQRRGIGTALVRRLIGYAQRAGFAAVVAHVAADDDAMLRTLRRFGTGTVDREGSLASVTLPLASRQESTDSTRATSA